MLTWKLDDVVSSPSEQKFFWYFPFLKSGKSYEPESKIKLLLSWLCTWFSAHFRLFQKFRRRKSARIAWEFIFLVSQKFVIYKILNTLKLFSFTVDSSVLLNKGVQFSYHGISYFFVSTADCQSSRNPKPTLFQIFRVFLTTGNFALYMSTMLEEKIC